MISPSLSAPLAVTLMATLAGCATAPPPVAPVTVDSTPVADCAGANEAFARAAELERSGRVERALRVLESFEAACIEGDASTRALRARLRHELFDERADELDLDTEIERGLELSKRDWARGRRSLDRALVRAEATHHAEARLVLPHGSDREKPRDRIEHSCVAADGSRVGVVSIGLVTVLERRTGRMVYQAEDETAMECTLSPGGRRLVVSTVDGRARLHHLDEDGDATTLQGVSSSPNTSVPQVEFTRDGSHLVGFGSEKTIVWNAEDDRHAASRGSAPGSASDGDLTRWSMANRLRARRATDRRDR